MVEHDNELGVHELPQKAPDAEHHPPRLSGVLLFDRDQSHAVAAALRRQVKIDHLRELPLQKRHEHLVKCDAEHGGLVRRLAGVGAVVDGVASQGDALDSKHGEVIDLVVIAGVIAKRALRRGLAGRQVALEDDLGVRRHLQVAADGAGQLGAAAAQQTRELVLRQRIGHRRDRAQRGRRIGTQRHTHRVGLTRIELTVVAVVERTATVRQPAHDELVAADDLLAVDAEVLPLLARTTGDGQAPGQQWADVARPAGLDRQLREVHRIALDHDLLARRLGDDFGRHRQDLFNQGQRLPGGAQALGRFGFFEEGQCLANLAQTVPPVLALDAHAQRHPLRRAEQVAEHGRAVARHVLEQNRRPAALEQAVAEFGHLEDRADRLLDTDELTGGLKVRDEVAQVAVFHAGLRITRNTTANRASTGASLNQRYQTWLRVLAPARNRLRMAPQTW